MFDVGGNDDDDDDLWSFTDHAREGERSEEWVARRECSFPHHQRWPTPVSSFSKKGEVDGLGAESLWERWLTCAETPKRGVK